MAPSTPASTSPARSRSTSRPGNPTSSSRAHASRRINHGPPECSRPPGPPPARLMGRSTGPSPGCTTHLHPGALRPGITLGSSWPTPLTRAPPPAASTGPASPRSWRSPRSVSGPRSTSGTTSAPSTARRPGSRAVTGARHPLHQTLLVVVVLLPLLLHTVWGIVRLASSRPNNARYGQLRQPQVPAAAPERDRPARLHRRAPLARVGAAPFRGGTARAVLRHLARDGAPHSHAGGLRPRRPRR